MKGGKTTQDDVDQLIQSALSDHPLPLSVIDQGKIVFRVQPSDKTDPVFYNRSSNSRYGDKNQETGVCYVAGSGEVAVAETLQHGRKGPGTRVLQSEIESKSLHQMKTARDLNVVDAARLAANSGRKLSDIVASKGQGSKGYTLSQAISAACMKQGLDVDGIIYPSRVYPITGVFEGCNLALFEGRETQLIPDGDTPLVEVELSTGETIGELLIRLKVVVE